MSNQALETALPAILSRADELPSLPAVAVEVLRLTHSDETTIDELAEVLMRDPALSAKLLRLSNSAMFNPADNAVTSMTQAAMLLGLKTVKLMSLSFSLASVLPNGRRGEAYDYEGFWRYSLCAAVAGRSVGKLIGSPWADEGFTCGLFTRLGQIVLHTCLADQYAPVLADALGRLPTLAEERRLLGFDSTLVGAALLKEWGLPAELHMAIGASADPAALAAGAPAEIRELSELVHMAELACRVVCDRHKGSALQHLNALLGERHGLSEEEVEEFLLNLEGGIQETAEMLSIELPGGESHRSVIDRARAQIVQISLDATADLTRVERRAHNLEEQNKILANQATTDRLTGLANRAHFDDVLARSVRQRLAEGLPLALGLILIDIDHFKNFNDSYGHLVGDKVLETVGRTLVKYTRDSDLPARYGGEEFAIICPQTSLDGMRVLAERLRFRIAQQAVEHEGKNLSVNVSIGGACVSRVEGPDDGKTLIKLADHFLYQAKERGRNRCEFYPKLQFPRR